MTDGGGFLKVSGPRCRVDGNHGDTEVTKKNFYRDRNHGGTESTEATEGENLFSL